MINKAWNAHYSWKIKHGPQFKESSPTKISKESEILRVVEKKGEQKKMTLKKLDADPSTLETVLEELKSDESNRNKINFILFLANNDPTTNRSWCPGPLGFSNFFF